MGHEISSVPKYHYFFSFATANLHIYITGPLPVRHLLLKPQFTTLFPYSISVLFLYFYHQSEVSGNLFQKCKWVIFCPVLAYLKMSLFSSHSKSTQLCVRLLSCKSFASKLHCSILVGWQCWKDLGRGVLLILFRTRRILYTKDFYQLGNTSFIRL